MAKYLSDIVKNGIVDLELGVVDPSVTGVAAENGTFGVSTDGNYWVKDGGDDDDWERILISTNGEYEDNFKLTDASVETLSVGQLGHVSGKLVMGDGIAPYGNFVMAPTNTVVYKSSPGVIDDVIVGDIPDDWKSYDADIKGVIIGSSCTSIGSYAFYGIGATGTLTFPNSVTSIGSYAFNSSTITGLQLPNTIVELDDYAFGFCTSLTGTVIIPESMADIGLYAFYNCSSLTQIDCYTSKSVLDSSEAFFNSGVIGFTGSAELGFTAGSQEIGGKTMTVTLR